MNNATSGAQMKVRNIHKRFGAFTALNDVSLDIAAGELVCLLGPSGCGKTTLLRCIAGLERQDRGELYIGERDVSELPPQARDYGILFQSYALFPNLTVEANIAYGLMGSGREQARQRVVEMLQLVGLSGSEKKYPGQLSGGQQQRVALARALVFEPQLVLMDEPLGALDKQLREHMQIELKALHRRLGVTFVYVTHDQSEALTMSDRVAVFNDGLIQQIDRVDRLYEEPINRFVAGFVGDNTVLSGTLQGAGADTAIQLPGGYLLPGVNVNQAALGSAVHACVRPERIVLHAHSEYPKTSAIPATVARAIYYGDHLRLMCDLGHGQEPATVKVALASSASNPHPQPGDAVLLEFPPVSTRIYAV